MASMPKDYYNNFDPAKGYERILYRDGYTLQGAELNEQQSAALHRLRGVADALFKDGDVIRDAQIVVDAATGEVRAQSGLVYVGGLVRNVPEATFSIPVEETVTVGVRLAESVVSELDDPLLYNPAVGSRGEGEPGAWRLRVAASWGHGGDGVEGDFYPVYTVDEGVLRPKEAPPSLDAFTQSLARYDRDSTAGGTYIVSGLTVRSAEDADGAQVYTVSEGRARVNGYGIDIPTSRRIAYAAVPDLRTLDTEVYLADDSGNQRIDVAHPPIHGVPSVRLTVRKSVSLVHGAYAGAADALPDTSVVTIVSVRQGDTAYVSGTDYRRVGDTVDWSPSGNEPSPGSTYDVVYDYITAFAPLDLDADGFTVRGAVPDSQIIISYQQALPRRDRLCLTAEGAFVWLKGVASEYNAVPPDVPDSILALATVSQTWRDTRAVSRDGAVQVYSFGEIELIRNRMDYMLRELSRQRLESDVTTRENGLKAGLFVDSLLDDSMRDQGITQTGAVFDGVLTLPITATVHPLPGSVDVPTSREVTPVIVLEQPLRTGSMSINPYQSFDPLPAKVTLTPAVDRWTETQTNWTSAVTRTFKRSTGTGGVSGWSRLLRTETKTDTQVVSVSNTRIENLRRIDVAFSVAGFGPGERLKSMAFDGIDVTPETEVTADAAGTLSGSFRIPEGVPAGSKAVAVMGEGGSRGESVFVGQGTLTTQTLRKVTNVTNWYYDPLAQTFVVDEDMQIAGVDLWFTAKGGDVRVQVREVSSGVPTRATLAEAVVAEADIVASGGGHTRVPFPSVLTLTANTEYALVILCDDPMSAVAVAEMGKFDDTAQRWVSAQPYTIGVLLSSSNASTWTAHHERDLTFRLLRAGFTGTRTVDLGTVAVEDATDLMLLALADVPSAQARIDYALALPDGTRLVVADSQPVELAGAVTGDIAVTATLSGTEAWSPVLWPDTQLLVGKVAASADYYARSVPARAGDQFASRAILIYDALVPSGATVTPEIQIDGGDWQAMEAEGTTQQGEGVVEFRFAKALLSAQLVKARLKLAGTSAARPFVANIRFMAVI